MDDTINIIQLNSINGRYDKYHSVKLDKKQKKYLSIITNMISGDSIQVKSHIKETDR